MADAFTNKGAGANQLHRYTSTDDLYTNALMKRDSFVMIRDAGGEFVYYIPDSNNGVPKTLINVETGQALPINNFIDRPIDIGRVPESRALSSYGVWARSAKYAKEGISKGVNFYGVNVDSNEYSRAMDMMRSEESKLSGSVRRALGEASEMTAKKMASIDFETGVPMAMEKRAGSLQSKMVLTGAMSETTDYAVHLKGSPDGLSEMRVRQNKAVEYFDLDTARSWLKAKQYSSDNFFMNNKEGEKYLFGKKNFALLLDVARERRMFILKKRMGKSQAARAEFDRLAQMGSLLEKHVKGEFGAGQDAEEFKKRYGMFRSDLRNMVAGAVRNERNSKSRNIDPSDSTRHQRYTTYKSVGRLSYTSMYGTAESQITTTDLRLTSDVTGALAEDMAEYTARTGQNVNAFGTLEADVLRQKMSQLRLVMGGTGPQEQKAIAQGLHEKLGKALTHLNDVKSLSQLFLHDYLPNLQTMAQSQRTVFDKVADRLGIHGEVKSEILDNLEINPKNPFTRGFSLEQLIRTMHADAKGYKEYHVASMDASDLNSYVELLDRVKEGSDTVKRSKSLTGSTAPFFKYGVEATQENLWETSAKFASEVNSKTMASLIMEKMDSKAIAKILRKGKLTALPRTLETFAARNIGGNNSTAFEVSDALTGLIKEQSHAVISDIVSDQHLDSQKRIALNGQPGFLSRILSRQHVPRIFAFYAAAQMMRTPDGVPQNGYEGIERGEHASIATIARRISTSDFGSPVSFAAPMARKLIGNVLSKSMSILRRGAMREGIERAEAVATTRGLTAVTNVVHPENLKWAAITAEQKGFMEARDPTLRMVVESAEQRVAKQAQGTSGGYLAASMRDKLEKQLAYEQTKQYNAIISARSPRPWERDPNKFALLETTQKVDKHMISLKGNARSYRTSPYGDVAMPEHNRMPVEQWFGEQQISPGHQWTSMQRNRFSSPFERAVREDATLDAGRKLGSFQKRIMTGAETIAHKQRMGQRELAADLMRTDYSDGMQIPIRRMNPGVIEDTEIITSTRPIHGMDVKNAASSRRNQWIAQTLKNAPVEHITDIPLYTPEGTTTSLDMSPAQPPLGRPKHRIMSAHFSNRKEKVPVLPIISVPKAPLEKPVIMPTNIGPAGIAPVKVPRRQPPQGAYHELFAMNMKTRKSNGWESNQRMVDMAMAGMPR